MKDYLSRTWLAALVAFGPLACGGGGDPEPQPLEVGYRDLTRDPTDQFVALADGDAMAVVLGANGLNMIVPSLRATNIDPSKPDPSVEIQFEGIPMAADIQGALVDMEANGDGYVLWDLRVPFQYDLCCYNCATGRVMAQINDDSGQRFIGEVSIQFGRADCPDPGVCCTNPEQTCPLSSLANTCE